MKYVPKKRKSHGQGLLNLTKFKKLGKGVIFERDVRVFHPENILIGNNVYIGHNTFLKAYYKNKIVIGSDTWIGQYSFLHGAGGITIGKAVGIGPCVKKLTSHHKEEKPDKPLLFCKIVFKEVVIGDGCDIGIGSIILPGIKIGEGSIIGAGSVVTKNVEPYTVVAGNPARTLRKRKD